MIVGKTRRTQEIRGAQRAWVSSTSHNHHCYCILCVFLVLIQGRRRGDLQVELCFVNVHTPQLVLHEESRVDAASQQQQDTSTGRVRTHHSSVNHKSKTRQIPVPETQSPNQHAPHRRPKDPIPLSSSPPPQNKKEQCPPSKRTLA
jgi:hypothetical protein